MNASHERLLAELSSVGLAPRGFTNGVPIGDWPENDGLAQLVVDLHIPDQELYLGTNLDSWAKPLATRLGAESAEWIAYRRVQTDLIRECRRFLYGVAGGPNEDFLAAVSDGADIATAQDELVHAKAVIKLRYPWPGPYRGNEEPAIKQLIEAQAPTEDELPKAKKKRKRK